MIEHSLSCFFFFNLFLFSSSTTFDKQGIVFFYFAAGGAQRNTSARSNAAGDTRASPLGGLGALPDLQRMLGGMPDASSVNQLMQNPAMSQMIQSLLSDPQHMNQVFIYLFGLKFACSQRV